MKLLFIFSLLIAAVWATRFRGYTQGHDGRPGCVTSEEVDYQFWRNNFYSNRYWECVILGVPGEARFCKTEFQFQPSLNKCVHYLEWKWTPKEDPLTLA